MESYYIDCAEGGRVRAASGDTPVGVLMAVPEGFTPENQMDYRMENGELLYDPLPEEPPMPTDAQRLAAVEAALLELALGGELDG
ncbi:MAG: hypothetical protein VB087_09850 [Candidatus Limiplasma sp.]|nr:hypothetical protein [Candidatus Limiplasma sp.]MEA5146014.1 hypothetical protein [Candidatus Limiplasma sp.]